MDKFRSLFSAYGNSPIEYNRTNVPAQGQKLEARTEITEKEIIFLSSGLELFQRNLGYDMRCFSNDDEKSTRPGSPYSVVAHQSDDPFAYSLGQR